MHEMTSALDYSPLEALALNYLSYGFLTAVNHIWPWIAVLTAAVSFWSIRSLSSPVPVESPYAASLSSAREHAAAVSSPSAGEANCCKQLSSGNPNTTSCVLETECLSKVKFSVYYNEDEFTEIDEDNGGCNVNETEVSSEKLGFRYENDDVWEGDMVLRMGDMGWYRCQDFTVLDGSVVRLWDSSRRRHAVDLAARVGAAW